MAAQSRWDLVTLPAPVDWKIDDVTVIEPDLVVTEAGDISGAHLSQVPLLVAEVLSPSTRLIDLGSKRLLYARAGVQHHWIVDPADPRLTVLQLDGAEYRCVGEVSGGEAYVAEAPFAVEVTPAALVAGTG